MSLGTLIIRSPKSDDSPTNIDLIFFGAAEFHLPAYLIGLELFKGQELSSTRYRFFLNSGDRQFFIDCVNVSIYENDLDIFEFWHPVHGANDLGHLIARGRTEPL